MSRPFTILRSHIMILNRPWGALEYGPEVPELCLPAGVWIDRINHYSVRVLPA
ncbi:hypothetical protein [Nonomuraea sp. NPDC049480]|uniref:hypothetical protein n=1 Tax=Nonomuraea sp. NPDC049480 TaxID=3364353 RepID=UPI0037B82072